MSQLDTLLSHYDFPFPQSHIATTPAHPRDSAQLLVYNRATSEATFDTFLHLDKYLEKGTLLILNDTKVVPARLPCHLPTGGKVELLWLAQKSVRSFEALSPRTLAPGDTLRFDTLTLTVQSKNESVYTIEHTGSSATFMRIMQHSGTTPIPPYIKGSALTEAALRKEYQTIWAKRAGSVAAPTASLHFTKRLITKLKKKGVEIRYVTLHVGLGTFAPLTEEHLSTKTLHEEWYEIPPATMRAIIKAKKEGRPIIPVGTTALRTLESISHHTKNSREAARLFEGVSQADGPRVSAARTRADSDPRKVLPLRGITNLFIQPGYEFKIADGIITNFHVPRSSLVMLVAALVGRETLLALYRSAIARGFRLFSFGDGMLIR